jgi:hypothetical protein
MLSLRFRRNTLLSLFVLALILLLIHIVFKSVLLNPETEERIVSTQGVSERFLIILDDFGIEKKLIKVNKIKDKSTGQIIPNIKVHVPKDLSIPEILLDIHQSFNKDSLTFYSVEKVKGGKSILTLKKGNSIILQTEFNYSKDIFRDKGNIAFIIKDADPGNTSTASLIESATKLNFLIRPDSKYSTHLEFINENGKQFSILIDDEISEQKYKLDADFSEQRVVAVIKSLVNEFGSATFFIIDDKSKFFNSANRDVLYRELKKRKIKLFTFSDFKALDMDENIFDDFNRATENLTRDEGIVFLLNEESYQMIGDEIKKCKKRGYRIVNSSLLL